MTGVQTCALPIFLEASQSASKPSEELPVLSQIEGSLYLLVCAEGDCDAILDRVDAYIAGTPETDDGKARLIPVEWEPFPEQPTPDFPLVLNTGRTVEHWHTRTKTGEVPILERLSPNAWLEMNPRDARHLGLKAQDRVDVVSQRGRVRNVELRITETIAPGQVFVPFHYAEANANQVTQSAFDPISREPNYKQSAVRVERTTSNAQRPTPKKARRHLGIGNWKLGVDRREAERERGER